MKVSFQDLTDLTGFTYRTVKKRLSNLKPEKEGKSHIFNSEEALPLIYNKGKPDNEVLDLTKERARLAKEQADRLELQNAESRGQLIPADLVAKTWAKETIAFKTKMRAIPSKVALKVVASDDLFEVQEILTVAIKEACDELSRGDHSI